MAASSEGTRRRRGHRSGPNRRPGRAGVVLFTLASVLLVAVGIPWVLSGQGRSIPPPPPNSAGPIGSGGVQGSGLPVAGTPRPSNGSFPALSPDPAEVGVVAIRVRLDRLRIDLPVVEGDGLDAPIGKAAHYPGSAWPRGGSNVYLYAHAQQGMFLTLWDAQQGDEVVLDLVDGTQVFYVVDQILPRARWNDLSLLDPTPVEQLTLQTSTSYFATSPRFVVIAHPKA